MLLAGGLTARQKHGFTRTYITTVHVERLSIVRVTSSTASAAVVIKITIIASLTEKSKERRARQELENISDLEPAAGGAEVRPRTT